MCWAEGGLGGRVHDHKSFPWRAHLGWGRGSLITQAAFFQEACPMSDTPLNLVATSELPTAGAGGWGRSTGPNQVDSAFQKCILASRIASSNELESTLHKSNPPCKTKDSPSHPHTEDIPKEVAKSMPPQLASQNPGTWSHHGRHSLWPLRCSSWEPHTRVCPPLPAPMPVQGRIRKSKDT